MNQEVAIGRIPHLNHLALMPPSKYAQEETENAEK